MNSKIAARRVGQRGLSLIVVMLILIIVTILGIGGVQIALMGERSTRYDRDYLIATQAAEAALMDAEFDIRGPNTNSKSRVLNFTPDNTGVFITGCGAGPAGATSAQGLCLPPSDSDKPVWATVDFLDDSASAKTVEFGAFTGRVFQAGSSGIQPERAPRYIIEVVDDFGKGGNASASATPRPKMYRITAIGFGPRKEIQVVMQTAFRKEKG
jgi:type IV pilus assembly protein PilX